MSEEIRNLRMFRATDYEHCGIIIRRSGQLHVVETPNVAMNPTRDFAISMRNMEKLMLRGELIVGFFHTHLPGQDVTPTDTDLMGAKRFPDYQNVVYKPSTGELVWNSYTQGVLREEQVGVGRSA